jgi:hypothetical protein
MRLRREMSVSYVIIARLYLNEYKLIVDDAHRIGLGVGLSPC